MGADAECVHGYKAITCSICKSDGTWRRQGHHIDHDDGDKDCDHEWVEVIDETGETGQVERSHSVCRKCGSADVNKLG